MFCKVAPLTEARIQMLWECIQRHCCRRIYFLYGSLQKRLDSSKKPKRRSRQNILRMCCRHKAARAKPRQHIKKSRSPRSTPDEKCKTQKKECSYPALRPVMNARYVNKHNKKDTAVKFDTNLNQPNYFAIALHSNAGHCEIFRLRGEGNPPPPQAYFSLQNKFYESHKRFLLSFVQKKRKSTVIFNDVYSKLIQCIPSQSPKDF